MKAMILAAGLGTRLRPLSFLRPKVLTPVWGMTMLQYWVERLAAQGVEGVIVNAFHLSEMLVSWVRSREWPIVLEVSLEKDLLGTGGGIRFAADFFEGEPFLAINGDILCSIDLSAFFFDHVASGNAVSLVLHDCPEFNNVAVNGSGQVLGFGREAAKLAGSSSDVRLAAFTGIHCIRPQAFESLVYGVPEDILTLYRRLIATGQPPRAYFPDRMTWREMGSLSSYAAVHAELAGLPPGAHPPLMTGVPHAVHPSAKIAAGAKLLGYVAIGKRCQVAPGAVLEDVILWDDVEVAARTTLRRCIVGDGVRVSGRHEDEVLADSVVT